MKVQQYGNSEQIIIQIKPQSLERPLAHRCCCPSSSSQVHFEQKLTQKLSSFPLFCFEDFSNPTLCLSAKIASNLCVFSPGSLTPAPHPSSSPSPPVASLSFPPQSRVESQQRRWTREKWALQHFDKTTANERFPNLPFFLGEKRQNNCKWQQSVQQFFDL